MFGLTFIAVAAKQSGDNAKSWNAGQHLHRRVVLSTAVLSDEEKNWLCEIEKRLLSGELPQSKRSCPQCGNRFQAAKVNGVELDGCSRCRSIWFDPGELQAFSQLTKEIPSDDKTRRASRFRCPDCKTQLEEFVFINPNTLLVDRCPNGHGVFLEEGELQRVFEIS